MAVTSRRRTGLATASAIALSVAGCGGGEGRPGGAWVGASPTARGAQTAGQPAQTSEGLAEVTSACRLLPASVVVKVLGGSASSKLTAKEEPVQQKPDGERRFHCSYGRDGQEALVMLVSTRPERADTAPAAIDAIAEASRAKTTRVEGVGAGAVGYATEGARLLAVAERHEAELRLVVLTGPAIVPHDRFVKLARHVVAQI